MKIALLQADHVPEHRHTFSGGNYPTMFANLFYEAGGIVDLDVFDVTIEEYPTEILDYDGFIITGSKASAYAKDKWILRLKEFILHLKDLHQKIVGICFGHQILAETLGGKVALSDKGWGVGVQTIKVLSHEKWMAPYFPYCSLLFYHQDQVIKVPQNAIVLACNDFCEIQMFVLDDSIIGIQAHPEMLRAHNHALLKEMLEHEDKNKFKVAIDSLRLRDNGLMIGMWIMNFFEME